MSVPDHSLNLDQELELDRICQRYEQEYRAGNTPDLEQFLGGVEEPLLSRLKEELDYLAADLEQSLVTGGGLETPVAGSGLLPIRIGRYRVVGRIGEGGMGSVYEAVQDNPQRTVALKVIRAGLDSFRIRRRFRREAHVLGRLHHPGIAQIFEAGTDDAEYEDGSTEKLSFFAMEFVEGSTLGRYAEEQKLEKNQRLLLVRRICDAVQHAHDRGVIHRDLKPANILVSTEPTTAGTGSHGPTTGAGTFQGQLKILDFGVARIADVDLQTVTEQTAAGQLLGTVPYMSPEQVEADPTKIDQRSDVYAIGVILYELLAGRLPHDLHGRPLAEAMRVIQEEDASSLSSIDSSYRGDIDVIVAKALEKERERRYASAAELGADIQRHLNDEPIVARPASAAYHLAKFARRHKGLVAGLALTLITLSVGLAVSIRYAISESELREKAEELTRSEKILRAEAVDSAAEARREANRAEAVSDYLMTLLKGADPNNSQTGKSQTLVAAILTGAKYIGESFVDEPLTEAAVRRLMAEALVNLGHSREALEQSERAVALQLEHQGEEHLETARIIGGHANVLTDFGRYDEAETLIRRVLAIRLRLVGEEHEDTANSYNNLGRLLHTVGRVEESEQSLTRSLEIRRRLLSLETRPRQQFKLKRNISDVLNNLAALYHDAGRLDEAETLYLDSLALRMELFGDNTVLVAQMHNNLGLLAQDRSEFRKAEDHYLKVLTVWEELLGADHPRVATVLNNLASLYYEMERYADADPLYRRALEIRREAFGEVSMEVANTLNNIAANEYKGGDEESAAKLIRQAVEVFEQVLGQDHPDIGTLKINMAGILAKTSSPEVVEQTFLDGIAILRNKLGHRSPRVASGLMNLGEYLQQVGRLEECKPYLLDAYDIQKEALGDDNISTGIAADNLGSLYRQLGEYDQSVEYHREGLRILRNLLEPDSATAYDGQVGLIRSLILAERFEEAEPAVLDLHERVTTLNATGEEIEACLRLAEQLYDEWGNEEESERWHEMLLARRRGDG